MICKNCNSENPDNARFCRNCGQAFYDIKQQPEQTTYNYNYTQIQPAPSSDGSGFSVAALVLGILGLLIPFSFIFPILALIFGIIGASKGGKKGCGIAGIVLGSIAIAIGILFIILVIISVISLEATDIIDNSHQIEYRAPEIEYAESRRPETVTSDELPPSFDFE